MDTFCCRIGAFVAPDCEGIHLVPIPTRSPPPSNIKLGHMEPKAWIRYKLDPWFDLTSCMDTFSSDNRDDDMDNSCLYHVFTEDQNVTMGYNRYITNLNFNRALPWYGSILVVKSRKEDDVVVDVVANDIPDIKRILVVYISKHLLVHQLTILLESYRRTATICND